jgi:hyperosmotically inducible periplasmic protein
MLRKGLLYGIAAVVASGALTLVLLIVGAGTAAAVSPTDSAVQTALRQDLQKNVPGVLVTVDEGMATLTGTVQTFQDKVQAVQIANRYKALARVVNHIELGGPAIDDQTLVQALEHKLASQTGSDGIYDSFYVQVNRGIVTLSGYAHNDAARQDALIAVGSERGVKDVWDATEVSPLSPDDDRIRQETARRIYAANGMGRYLADPTHPIHIVVHDGNVILEGSVASKTDRAVAQTAADKTPGVFSVTNNLRVDRKG